MLSRSLSRGHRDRGRLLIQRTLAAQTRLQARRRYCYCPCVFRRLLNWPTELRPIDMSRYRPRRLACQGQIERRTKTFKGLKIIVVTVGWPRLTGKRGRVNNGRFHALDTKSFSTPSCRSSWRFS